MGPRLLGSTALGSPEVYVVNYWHCILQSAWAGDAVVEHAAPHERLVRCRQASTPDIRLEWALSFDFSTSSTIRCRTGFWCCCPRHTGVPGRHSWQPRVAVWQAREFVYGPDSHCA